MINCGASSGSGCDLTGTRRIAAVSVAPAGEASP
jgi:hypothetical protein